MCVCVKVLWNLESPMVLSQTGNMCAFLTNEIGRNFGRSDKSKKGI